MFPLQENSVIVRVHLPLKQGLRLSIFPCCIFLEYVRVHLPLKQGLRPTDFAVLPPFLISASASSIKTRIKTNLGVYVNLLDPDVRVHLPLKQGLRLSFSSFGVGISWCECIFH